MHLTLTDPTGHLDDLWSGLRAAGNLAVALPRVVERRYFDSFDWRLYRAGLALAFCGDEWRLQELAGGRLRAAQPVWTTRWPRFASDFPVAGELRAALEDLLGVRALVNLTTARGEMQTWQWHDRDGGSILRGTVWTLRPARAATTAAAAANAAPQAAITTGAPVRWLELQAPRGQKKAAARAVSRLAALGCQPLAQPPLALLLRAAGIEPASYSPRFAARLLPAMSAREALREVGLILVRGMRQNEAGVAADLDTEFLHDLRVAVRRQRSALAIFKNVLPPEATAGFGRELAALGRLTGPLRDLDVWLLDEARYRALLPAALQPGLDLMFARLRTQRAVELQRVRLALASAEYRALVTDWSACLRGEAAGPRAGEPVLDLARRRLRRRYRRVLRDGRRIDTASTDSDLHRLRIQGKKLRYLLEFFASLFAADDVEALVAQLKRLQDNLGALNDLNVQSRRLADDLAAGRATAAEAAALGALLAALERERRRVRKRFAGSFATFASDEVGRRFARLLA